MPTSPLDCTPPTPECDTVFIEIPFIEWIYLDCETGLPCGVSIEELINESTQTGLLYDLNGKVIRKPEGIYIENGKIKYKL